MADPTQDSEPNASVVSYFQSAGGGPDGVVVFNGQIVRTTGRLDMVGSRVFASGFRYNGRRLRGISVIVQCERVSDREITMELTFLKPNGVVLASRCVERIPLSEDKTTFPRAVPASES